ncbi:MAG: nicotinamidase/pyrazinamidase [Myxococcota bacterium]|jgi:nicotinamidase/pyrazinamidase
MRALIVVDLQNDFMPGGPLGVSDARAVIPLANTLMAKFDLVIATQDWHPPGHGSFAASHDGKNPYDEIPLHGLPQTLWPTHCVQGTPGADFVDDLETNRFSAVVRKGTDPTVDSYSGFADNGNRIRTGLAGLLTERGVTEVFVCGVATDFCVRFTAEDAARSGFSVFLIEDACRGVALTPESVPNALDALRAAGVSLTTSAQV